TTPGIFSVLQVQPQLGRMFNASEAQPGSEHVAILLYDIWREQFSSDPGIVGKTIPLNGFPYTVIGVMPQSFHMPALQTLATIGDTNRPLAISVLVPMAFSKGQLAEAMGDLNYFGLARLRAGVSVAAATADLDALQHTISANLAVDERATLSVALVPFQEKLVGNNRKPLMILLAAVAGLLLVGCVNITNLLLARAVGQRQQMAVAAALGARRAEMVRMALRETAVLAIVGGGLGVLLRRSLSPRCGSICRRPSIFVGLCIWTGQERDARWFWLCSLPCWQERRLRSWFPERLRRKFCTASRAWPANRVEAGVCGAFW